MERHRHSKSLTILLLALLAWPAVHAGDVGDDDAGELDCVIEPHMVIDLSSRVNGIIESLEVERGELIEKGQILARLESGIEQAGVAEALARAEATAEILSSRVSYAFAQRRRARVEELHRSQAVSFDQMDEMATETDLTELQLQQARENKKIAELGLRQAREILKQHTIRSPIHGIVVQRYLSPGETVEDQPIMRLAQIDPLRVEVIVPVQAFGSIRPGQAAFVYPESPMEGEYPAKVTIVDGVADAASGTFRVRLGLPNEDYGLPSGLKCRVTFLPYEDIPGTQLALEPKTEPVSQIAEASDLSSPAQCQTVGPIKDAPEAERIMAALAEQAVQIGLREELGATVDQYLILSPPQPSIEEAHTLTGKMKVSGFTDFFVFRRGPHKGRVSLGLYRDKNQAEERRELLAGLGFESEIVPRTQRRPRFWLDVELLPRITALDLGAAKQALGNTDLSAVPCGIVAAEK